MSLFRTRSAVTVTSEQMLADRTGGRTSMRAMTADTAKRHSAVWACLRLRGDLISTLPVDAYRRIDGIQVEVSKPPMLVNPGGERVSILEWLYSTQGDLDSAGNAMGVITEVNGHGLPARIDLAPIAECSVRARGNEVIKYRICGKEYDPHQVWHERQYTVSGLPVGLSPVMYAAYSIGSYLSAQEYAADWFGGGAVPNAHLRNTAKTVTADEASVVKSKFKAAVAGHDLFVTGNDWEYDMISVPANQTAFIETMQFSVVDIARFFGAPADLIDAAVSGQSVTYASITQRNLQLLIHNLQPAITRRETALSTWLPGRQYVKLNTDAILRMDPLGRTEVIAKQIASRTLTVDEAREIENRQPLTPEQIASFAELFPAKAAPTGVKA